MYTGYLCGPEDSAPRSARWEVPKLASVGPKGGAAPAPELTKELHHQVSWACLNQLLATLCNLK